MHTTMIYPVAGSTSSSNQRPRRRSTSTSSSTRSSSQNFSRPSIARKPVPSTHPIPKSTSLPLRSHSDSKIQTTSIAPRPHRSIRKSKMPVYFLTGANRGIGLEFVRQLASKPSNTIIAGVRSLNGDISELKELAASGNSNIHIIECDVSSLDSLSSIEFRVAEILSKTGANLDYLFNIAGINATSTDTSLTLDPKSLAEHMQTNVLGPAKIVESLRKYLARGATVLNMSSGLGSLTVATDVTKCCTYSMSKAALNMLTLHQARDLKNVGVRVVCMDPGWVKTRMGGKGAMIEANVSVESMLDVVDNLKEKDSGKFYRYDGAIVPW
ncbi:NAD(P)-binding protein [Plenodomus tracheiphilus IPT5]|uniref:NAD(P)-binding protein n=1 Tax=Plenodomus tracheiphilus IPT5 TaxID=1408161 RepID=A0A6A7B4P5_9PLEO|nr:NAD(P)-binding protein [Plenodomus tracheiphilus IPT5]